MREKIVFDNWEYEIHEIENEYGFRVDIYKNKILVKTQGGFGSISGAEKYAKDYFLLNEFGIEREID